MAKNIVINNKNNKETKFLLSHQINHGLVDQRAFLSSENIDIFPCSRRGRSEDNIIAYDPEARLNTERTNRISTAINGFTDSFVDINSSDLENNTLVFSLAGYRVEMRNIDLNLLAKNLFASIYNPSSTSSGTIYAHLSLHDKVSLNATGYYTEILYRQSAAEFDSNDSNSLDVNITDGEGNSGKFFLGISFTNSNLCRDYLVSSDRKLVSYNLPIFNVIKSESGDDWTASLIQTSLLPKIEHGETEDSVKINGDFAVKGDFDVEYTKSNGIIETAFKVSGENGQTEISSLSVAETIEAETIETGELITTYATIYGLDVGTNIDTGTLKTNTITTNTITSDNTKIVVDKVLKVDTIDSDATKGLTVERKLTAKKGIVVESGYEVVTPKLRVDTITSNDGSILVDDKKLLVTKSLEVLAKEAIDEADRNTAAVATIDKAVIGQLEVKADPTKLVGSTGKIETDGQLTVGQYINVGSPTIPTATTGDVVAKNSIFAENNIVAKNTLKAPTIYQTVSGSDKPVPFIDIVEQANGQWQLQISRASTIAKQN